MRRLLVYTAKEATAALYNPLVQVNRSTLTQWQTDRQIRDTGSIHTHTHAKEFRPKTFNVIFTDDRKNGTLHCPKLHSAPAMHVSDVTRACPLPRPNRPGMNALRGRMGQFDWLDGLSVLSVRFYVRTRHRTQDNGIWVQVLHWCVAQDYGR